MPIYGVAPKEMEALVEKNGRFSIEKMELTNPASAVKSTEDSLNTSVSGNAIARHLRAGMEGILSNHFGVDIMDELFDRFSQKTMEFSERFNACHKQGTQLFLTLVKRK